MGRSGPGSLHARAPVAGHDGKTAGGFGRRCGGAFENLAGLEEVVRHLFGEGVALGRAEACAFIEIQLGLVAHLDRLGVDALIAVVAGVALDPFLLEGEAAPFQLLEQAVDIFPDFREFRSFTF